MSYSFLTDGLDADKKGELDTALEGKTAKAKVRKERDAAMAAMKFMK